MVKTSINYIYIDISHHVEVLLRERLPNCIHFLHLVDAFKGNVTNLII